MHHCKRRVCFIVYFCVSKCNSPAHSLFMTRISCGFSAGAQTANTLCFNDPLTPPVLGDGAPDLQDFYFAACEHSCYCIFSFIMGTFVKKHQVSYIYSREMLTFLISCWFCWFFLYISTVHLCCFCCFFVEFFPCQLDHFGKRSYTQRWDSLLDCDNTFGNIKGNSAPTSSVFTTAQKAKTDQTTAATHAAAGETPMPILSRESFSKFPQWDFEDVYKRDAPPRHTVSMWWQDLSLVSKEMC